MSAPVATSTRGRVWSAIRRWVGVALRVEFNIYRNLYRWIFRRPRVPTGASGFSYHQPVLTILVVFIVLSAVEIPILDLMTHRWPAVRIPILIAGVWGLTWMVGLLLGYLTRPHAVGPEGIRVRDGMGLDIALPWADVYSVARHTHTLEPKAPALTTEGNRTTLSVHIQQETNLHIQCEHPVTITRHGERVSITDIRLYAHDPQAFLTEVRQHLG